MVSDGLRFGLLSYPGSENLGDDIQSLAARRFLPRVDVVLPREALHLDPGVGTPVAIILNGWFMHVPRHWPPHPGIMPLLISMHLAATRRPRVRKWLPIFQDLFFADGGLEYLRRHGPVGARDPATLALLHQCGVDAWPSGCLTLTLPRPDVAPHARVVACDLSAEQLAALNRRLSRPALVTSHTIDPATPVEDRFAAAERQLRLYAGATSVVTTRVHAALPCLAIGTPVLFIDTGTDTDRIAPARALAHTCTAASFRAGGGFDPEAPPANPDRHRPLAEALEARCAAFVAAAGGHGRAATP